MERYGAAGSPAHNADIRSTEPSIQPGDAATLYPRLVKPVLDRIGGLLLLLLSVPILTVVFLLVRLTMGKPVIYRQKRVGLHGKVFDLYKFRTMIPDRRHVVVLIDGPDRRAVHKSPDDPRVLPLGKKLRAWRLDELPQLWNVVRGDMSLVGPRPEMPEIVADYEAWQHQRHAVKPGITGPWQISHRNGKLMHQSTEIDLEYVSNVRWTRDFAILARTPLAMIGRRRGY